MQFHLAARLAAILMAFAIAMPDLASAAIGDDLNISRIDLEASRRIGRTVFEYDFRVVIENVSATNYTNVTASPSSQSAGTSVVTGPLSFGAVNANGIVSSQQILTVRQDRVQLFNAQALKWTFDGSPETDEEIIIPEEALRDLEPLPEPEPPALDALSFYPTGLKAGSVTQILLTARISDHDQGEISTVEVTDSASSQSYTLRDDGLGSDDLADDGVFSATAAISAVGLPAGHCRTFAANAQTDGAPLSLQSAKLCVTELELGVGDAGAGPVLRIASTDTLVSASEAIVHVADEVSESTFVNRLTGLGFQVAGVIPELGTYRVKLREQAINDLALKAVLSELEALPEVEFAEPYEIFLLGDTGDAYVPNEPCFKNSCVDPAGNTVAKLQTWAATIRTDEAWFLSRGENVRIGIIDSGIDATNPEFGSRILNKQARTFLADWVYGFPVVEGAVDDIGHGTAVASVAAGAGNNGGLTAGLAWNAKILPIRTCFIDSELVDPRTGTKGVSRCDGWGMRLALQYLIEAQRVDVINMSVGGYSAFAVDPDTIEERSICPIVRRARAVGIAIVAAAGNDKTDARLYPAACLGAISVGGTGQVDRDSGANSKFQRWVGPEPFGSNFGSWVKIAAPAFGIATSGLRSSEGRPEIKSGTSFAAPAVSGAIALLLAYDRNLKQMKGAARVTEIERRLTQTAQPLPGQQLGAGLLDAFDLLLDGSFEMHPSPWQRAESKEAAKFLLITPALAESLPFPDGKWALAVSDLFGNDDTFRVGDNVTSAWLTLQRDVASLPFSVKVAYLSKRLGTTSQNPDNGFSWGGLEFTYADYEAVSCPIEPEDNAKGCVPENFDAYPRIDVVFGSVAENQERQINSLYRRMSISLPGLSVRNVLPWRQSAARFDVGTQHNGVFWDLYVRAAPYMYDIAANDIAILVDSIEFRERVSEFPLTLP